MPHRGLRAEEEVVRGLRGQTEMRVVYTRREEREPHSKPVWVVGVEGIILAAAVRRPEQLEAALVDREQARRDRTVREALREV